MEAADEEAPVSRLARLGLWLGPVLAAAVWLGLAAIGLKAEATRLAAITALMATWWMTEAAPVAVTAVLPLVLFPWLGVSPAKSVAPNYGHDLIWLFFGGFQLAFAIERRGLHRRIALFLVRLIGTRADRLVLGFMLAAGLLSMWLVNTSTTLMMLPVALAVAKAIEPEGDGPFGAALMLGLAYSASVGGMGTYLGTAPNGVFRGIAEKFGVAITFGQWMAFAAPLSLVLIGLIWVYLTRFAFSIRRGELPDDHPARLALAEDLGPWTPPQRRVAVLFAVTVAMWVSRRWLLEGLGISTKAVTDSTVAVGAAVLLFLLPAGLGRQRLLTWRDATATPWHLLLLFGGGFALADGFDATGLSRWLGGVLAGVTAGLPAPVVVLAVVLFMTFLTEVTSNTATATVLLPVIGGLAVAMHIAPALLMVPATLAASIGFMLPVATPPNAIVYGTGRVTLPQMARAGLWINLGSAVVITGWMLTWGRFTLPD
ncbi:MAG: sodium:proton antiporter [Myxococcales bacterium]|nr:sodium:proton antiporter [Myxococcales bacterium]